MEKDKELQSTSLSILMMEEVEGRQVYVDMIFYARLLVLSAKASVFYIQEKVKKCLRYVMSAYLVQAVRAAGKCDAVFKGFSDCLLKLGDSMANYPQGLDDKTNIKTVCTYWEDFHSCTVTALTDCQEGAKDMWDKLRKESKNLNIQGSLFELCGSGNGAAGSLLPALPVLLVSLSAALAAWLSF
uniref:Neuritin 1 n=1 Tax=Equus caballus TaxID=9796 RepID=A0A9L0RZD2_HORSE